MRRAGLVLSLVALSRSLLPFVAEARFDLWARTAPTLWLVFFFRCSSSLEHVFVQVAHCLAKKKTKRNEKQTVNIRLKERENKTEMGPYIIDDQREMMEEASYRHRTRTWNAGAEKQLRTEFFLLFYRVWHRWCTSLAISRLVHRSRCRSIERERMRFGWPPKRFHQQRDE